MTMPTDDRRISEGLDSLCEVVLTTLKELSATRQPISAAILRQAVCQKQEIVGLLYPSSQPAPLPPEAAGPANDPGGDMSARIQTLDTQRMRLSAQLDGMEEQNGRIREFNKRSLTSLIALLRSNDNKELTRSLQRFKQMLLDGAELELLDESLKEIKNLLLKEDSEGPKANRSEPGLWSRLTGRKGPEEAPPVCSDLNFMKLKEGCLDVFSVFHSDLGKEYLDCFTRAQQSIRGSQSIDELVAHSDEIVNLIQAYTGLINEERTRVISLFTEIGSNLAEMETHFMASADRSSQAQQADMHFNRTLEGELQEIDDSAQFSKSLEEFKGLVFRKLTTIKSALVKKRQDDELRGEENAREVAGLQKNLQTLKDEVTRVRERAKVLELETLIDPLTCIHNRRAYERQLAGELERYHRYQHVFSLLLFDLDYFKKVNDLYGHNAGDRCLKEIIKRIKPALRDLDFLARYGGEEFIVILPGTSRDAALNAAERLRFLVEKTRFSYQGKTIPITISVGLTEVKPSDQTPEMLFARADAAVYEAKRAGRNRVVLI
jgi:diguanylate cyclase (GGDEF)-like protein